MAKPPVQPRPVPPGAQPKPLIPPRVPPAAAQPKPSPPRSTPPGATGKQASEIVAGAIDRALRAPPFGKLLSAGDPFLRPFKELTGAIREIQKQGTRPQATPGSGVSPPAPSNFPRGTSPVPQSPPLVPPRAPTGSPFIGPPLPTGRPAPSGTFGPPQLPVNVRPGPLTVKPITVKPIIPPMVAPIQAAAQAAGGGVQAAKVTVGLATAARAAIPALTALAPLAVPIGALTILTGGTVLAFRQLNARSKELSHSLDAYDSALASAQARASIASMRQDISSAKYLGKDLARGVDAQNRQEIATKRIGDVLTKFSSQVVNPFSELKAGFLEFVANQTENAGAALEALENIATGQVAIQDLLKETRRLQKEHGTKADLESADLKKIFRDIQVPTESSTQADFGAAKDVARNNIEFTPAGKELSVR